MARKKLGSNSEPAESNVINIESARIEDGREIYTFELLAGYMDKEGTVHKDFDLREMDGSDEEAIHKDDTKGNASRLISVLLTRTCSRIGTLTPKSVGGRQEWEKIIKSLYFGDQDYMMLKLREISLGEDIEVRHQCPNCKRKLTTYLSYDELEIVPFSGDRKIKFELPKGYRDNNGTIHKFGTMRLPTGLDREIVVPTSNNNIAKAETMLLVRLCTFDDGCPIDNDVMKRLTIRDRNYLQGLVNKSLFGVKTQIDMECPDCGTAFIGNLNATNFI